MLEKTRGPDGLRCAICNGHEHGLVYGRLLKRYQCRSCGDRVMLTSGTRAAEKYAQVVCPGAVTSPNATRFQCPSAGGSNAGRRSVRWPPLFTVAVITSTIQDLPSKLALMCCGASLADHAQSVSRPWRFS